MDHRHQNKSRNIRRRLHRNRRHNDRQSPKRICRIVVFLVSALFLGGVAITYLRFFQSLAKTNENSNFRQRSDADNRHISQPKSNQNRRQEFISNPNVNYNIHAFYYPWYCTPKTDGEWMHWNHPFLPHWDEKIAKRYPTGAHEPPNGDIGASFYPKLGPYSSADPVVIKQHFEWFIQAKIGVAVVSWLPPGQHDDNGPPIAKRLPQLLDLALEAGIKVALHMEPYEARSPESFEADVQSLLEDYGDHPAMYKLPKKKNGGPDCTLPVMYVYDQYRISSQAWRRMFQKYEKAGDKVNTDGACRSVFPAVTLALVVEQRHWREYAIDGGFDGGYTYFASNSFTFGSNPKNWKRLQSMAETGGDKMRRQHHNVHEHRYHHGDNDNAPINANDKYFIPSIGPGYDDTQVRPWNQANTHDRNGGEYYSLEWAAAIESGASIVSITSFNEWHEGTQIEPAIPYLSQSTAGQPQPQKYRDYGLNDGGPMKYLDLTKKWVEKFEKQHQGQL